MMHESLRYQTIGMRLRGLREAAGLSQRETARRAGVGQAQYSQWECDSEPVPEQWLPSLAGTLGADVGLLRELNLQAAPGRRQLPALIRQCHSKVLELPWYDVRGTIGEVLEIREAARRIFSLARQRLSAGQLAHLEQYFPRDSAWELLTVFHIIALGGILYRVTLAQLRCPLFATEARNSVRCGLYHQRTVLLLERPKSTIVFVPQPWVVSPTQSAWYRLDFLACIVSDDRKLRWADVEIDGSQHPLDPEKDRRRARGIACPRLGFPTWQVERFDFGQILVSQLEEMLVKPQPAFTFVEADGKTPASDPFDPWFSRPARKIVC